MANGIEAWYADIIGQKTLRDSGMKEITETNPLDWERLRLLDGDSLVPALAKGHVGTPGPVDMALLKKAAEEQKLFLYRLGEEYPYQLVNGVWYSTDPAAANEPKPTDEAAIPDWEARVNFFEKLEPQVLRAIRDEAAPRRDEIQRNQEKQRADALDSQPPIEWYNQEFKQAVFQPGKGPSPEGNAMDWRQMQIWDGQQFVPAMPEGHKGEPDVQGMKRLRDAAQKGNLYFYRWGDDYPQRLENGIWYDTDPVAVQEQRPTLQEPVEPKEPVITATLASELQERNLAPDIKSEYLRNDAERRQYQAAINALAKKLEVYEKEQEQYQKDLAQYQADRKAYDEAMGAWEKRVAIYDQMGANIKEAIQNNIPQRREELRLHQEEQREAINNQPLGRWYNEGFRRYVLQPSKDPELRARDGMDWDQVRIWDGKEFTRVVPEGFEGVPDNTILQNLREATEKGNLFMYQRGEKYPSKWTGNTWSPLDKSWIDLQKPKELEELPGRPIRPVKPLWSEYEKGVSEIKVFLGRGLRIKAFRGEVEKYETALRRYDADRDRYNEAMSRFDEDQFNRDLTAYNDKVKERQARYDEQNQVYEKMLKQYEALTPEQKTAMEKEVQQRTEEIKQNKELQKQAAEEKLAQELDARAKITDADARIDAMGNQPNQETFLNRGAVPLGQQVYDAIAANAYQLPVDSKITSAEAAAIHLALAGSSTVASQNGLGDLDHAQYGQMLNNVLLGTPAEQDVQYLAAAYNTGGTYIRAYEGGNAADLSAAMGQGMRNLIAAGRENQTMSPEMAARARLMGRMLDVLDRHEDLMANSGLTQEELTAARGMVNLGRIYDQYLTARIELTRVAAGALQLSPQKMNEHTANLLIGKMTESRLQQEQNGSVEPKMLEVLGKGKDYAMNIVQYAYRDNPAIKEFANDPQALKQMDLDKRAQALAGVFGNTPLASPKESTQLREQVNTQVKEQMEQNSPQAVEERKRQEQLDMKERQEVRDLLAQQDPTFKTVSFRDSRVTEKLEQLREAREALEKSDARRNVSNQYELTDPKVQNEAMERASVRELMQHENLALQASGKAARNINDFTVERRLNELRRAQKELSNEDRVPSLTSMEVVNKAAENKTKRSEQFKKTVEEGLQAQDVFLRETGAPMTASLWRSTEVRNRTDRLRRAREELGEEGKNLPLNDMRVIQQDYRSNGIDPVKSGIVDIATLTPKQKKDYDRRMETLDFLKTVRGVEDLHPNRDRYHARVDNTVKTLESLRGQYELFIRGAETGLPLNHPKIAAMYLFDNASMDSSIIRKLNFEDVAKLSQDIQGKTFSAARALAGQQIQAIQARNPQPQQEMAQPQVPVVQAPQPPVQGPPGGG